MKKVKNKDFLKRLFLIFLVVVITWAFSVVPKLIRYCTAQILISIEADINVETEGELKTETEKETIEELEV